MKNITIYFLFSALLSGISYGQTPEAASKILDEAFRQASAEKKNVMVIFHASWCGWCKRLDQSINDPACKDFFDRSYVIKHLTIMESGEKKNLENPGALELYEKNGGKGQGIPYFLIFDGSGKLLSDSKMAGKDGKMSNIGCPASDEEVAAFVGILGKSSSISQKETEAITARFRKNRN